MSADAMDVDPVSSPEKKRKHREKHGHSSKKRKHDDDDTVKTSPTQHRKEKKHRKRLAKSPSPSPKDADLTRSPRKPLSKHTASQLTAAEPLNTSFTSTAASTSAASSPFRLITASLYLPLSPISISPTHALSSLLSEHVSPLLLTYYPPVRGILLAYSNPSLSSTPPSPSSSPSTNPLPLAQAVTAGEYGVLYVYLKITFLVFRPERGQTFEGWINVQSESFLGAVVFNLFSVGIERRRLPADWKWIAPGEEQNQAQRAVEDENETSKSSSSSSSSSPVDSDKENFTPLPRNTAITAGEEEDDEISTGFFQTPSGKRVRGTIRFRIRDVDVIPGSERDKGFISLEGTMLSPEEEEKLVEEERARAEGVVTVTGAAKGRRHPVIMATGALIPQAGAGAGAGKQKKKSKAVVS